MKKTYEKYYCDICGKEVSDTSITKYNFLGFRRFDATEGKSYYNPPIVVQCSAEICDNCAMKIASKVFSKGVQCEQYEIVEE